jgi:hypothetical protein
MEVLAPGHRCAGRALSARSCHPLRATRREQLTLRRTPITRWWMRASTCRARSGGSTPYMPHLNGHRHRLGRPPRPPAAPPWCRQSFPTMAQAAWHSCRRPQWRSAHRRCSSSGDLSLCYQAWRPWLARPRKSSFRSRTTVPHVRHCSPARDTLLVVTMRCLSPSGWERGLVTGLISPNLGLHAPPYAPPRRR